MKYVYGFEFIEKNGTENWSIFDFRCQTMNILCVCVLFFITVQNANKYTKIFIIIWIEYEYIHDCLKLSIDFCTGELYHFFLDDNSKKVFTFILVVIHDFAFSDIKNKCNNFEWNTFFFFPIYFYFFDENEK